MGRTTTLKVMTIGAALGGLSLLGAGTATAADIPPAQAGTTIATSINVDPPQATDNTALPKEKAANASQTKTRGSTQIYTAPNPNVGLGSGNPYGPFFHQHRGLGGAAAIGAAAAGR